jgi:hypothetical protein
VEWFQLRGESIMARAMSNMARALPKLFDGTALIIGWIELLGSPLLA